jgi:hypothetical protein
VGSAFASTAEMLSVEEASTGELMPNNCSECASSCLSRNSAKSNVATAAARWLLIL